MDVDRERATVVEADQSTQMIRDVSKLVNYAN